MLDITGSVRREPSRCSGHIRRDRCAFFGLIALAAVVIRLVTAEGELVIESTDPDLQVVVTQDGRTVKELELQRGADNTLTLRAGQYQVRLTSPSDEIQIDRDSVTLKRRGTATVRVYRVAAAPVAKKAKETSPAPPATAKAVPLRPGTTDRPSPVGESKSPIGIQSLVERPPTIPGLLTWTIETVHPRGRILDVEFSPDGKSVATVGADHRIRIWDAESGALRRILVGNKDVYHLVRWSPDGRMIAACKPVHDISLEIWDVENARLLLALLGQSGTVQVWKSVTSDAPQRRQWQISWREGTQRWVGWLDEGKIATDNGIWNADTGEQLRQFPFREAGKVTYDRDGARALCLTPTQNSREVQLWDLEAAEHRVVTSWHTAGTDCRVSFDGTLLATFGGFHIWETSTGRLLRAANVAPTLARWSPTGTQCVVHSSSNHSVGMVDVAEGTFQQYAISVGPPAGGISTDGALLAGFGSDRLTIADLASRQNIREYAIPPLEDGTRAHVIASVWLPGSRTLVAADRTARLLFCDVDAEEAPRIVPTPYAPTALAASPDGTRVALASGLHPGRITRGDVGAARQIEEFSA